MGRGSGKEVLRNKLACTLDGVAQSFQVGVRLVSMSVTRYPSNRFLTHLIALPCQAILAHECAERLKNTHLHCPLHSKLLVTPGPNSSSNFVFSLRVATVPQLKCTTFHQVQDLLGEQLDARYWLY